MAGTWQALANQPPFAASTMLLLSDGTVMCQESGGLNWWKLKPDPFGDYVKGAWSQLAPMHYTRLYYASALLADGRVIVAGGEYSNAGNETNTAEIYDSLLDKWTEIVPPRGWARIGDAPCCVLPNGKFLLGNIDDTLTAIYDPVANTWVPAGNKDDRSSEETWTLLPDNTVLNVECTNHPRAEKYLITEDRWVSAGTLPVDLVEASSIEIGPAFLLPNGHVFAVGCTKHTALYMPPAIASDPGTWVAGPDFPQDGKGQTLGAKDAAGCLLPNGKVLCVAGPVTGKEKDYLKPTLFFEFDGSSLARVPDPPNANKVVPFQGRMMIVPTGQVLFAADGPEIYVYTPDGSPDAAWRPYITDSPASLQQLGIYTLDGRQLNGLSQAVSYGDDAASATNYPLVRIRNRASGKVWYCRTYDHSTMGVATGTSIQSTHFTVPLDVEPGPAELCVVVNGIVSDGVEVNVQPQKQLFSFDPAMVDFLVGNLTEGTPVLGPNGPIPAAPWGPKIAKQARQARNQIIAGVKTLQSLGRQVATKRIKANKAVPPEVDPDLQKRAKVKGTVSRSKLRGKTASKRSPRIKKPK